MAPYSFISCLLLLNHLFCIMNPGNICPVSTILFSCLLMLKSLFSNILFLGAPVFCALVLLFPAPVSCLLSILCGLLTLYPPSCCSGLLHLASCSFMYFAVWLTFPILLSCLLKRLSFLLCSVSSILLLLSSSASSCLLLLHS